MLLWYRWWLVIFLLPGIPYIASRYKLDLLHIQTEFILFFSPIFDTAFSAINIRSVPSLIRTQSPPLVCRYLSEFLYAWLMSTLSRADSSQMAEERILEEQQQKGRSSKKSKKKKKGMFHFTLTAGCFICYSEMEVKFRMTSVSFLPRMLLLRMMFK